MISIRRSALLRSSAACAALLVALPSAVWAWGGTQHLQINKAAGRNVPAEMVGFPAFSRPMALPGIYPDLWKESDPDETPRHYFEPDQLPAQTDIRDLSPVMAEAFAKIGLTAEGIGIAPWTINDLLTQMTAAMRTNDWVWAARCGAALGHYVGDLHMPLHCTRNYNGQDTGQMGVHMRLEIDMVKAFFHPDQMHPAPAVYIDNPFRAIMEWTAHSATLVPAILDADLVAKRAANGRIDTERYYRKFWELTSGIVDTQIGDAVTHLSSLWYTAWVNAGKPAIPGPLDELPTPSVFSGVSIDPPNEGGPVGAATPRQRNTYDTIIWSFMGGIGLIIIASSIYRGIQAKKPKS
jgi:hypothetical protein